MLEKTIAHNVIDSALRLGADFCDLFIEKSDVSQISFKSSDVHEIQSGINFGIGIRLIKGLNSLYAYTNSPSEDELIRLVHLLAANIENKKSAAHFTDFQEQVFPEIKMVNSLDKTVLEKIEHLKILDQAARSTGNKIVQVNAGILEKKQWVEIYNSEGLHATDFRPYIRLTSSAIASDGGEQNSASHSPGARGGYQFINDLNMKEIGETLGTRAVHILEAKPCPAGKMPVVIDNGFGGVIFHEACGHLLETTSVQKKASVFWDKKGEQIAHEALSATDDGTNDFLWGSLSIDDEGMPTQRTELIKNGKLTNFICDKMGELKTGHPRTGSGRKQSYRFAPASRMRNTFIEPGPHSLDDLIQNMGDGLYAKYMGGGSVNPGTGEFNFSVEEGYMVKNGKIGERVKGATLIGSGADIMTKISMVGNKLDFAAGMCGSVSGSLPVTVGQPAIKVDEILVGGKA